jgi:hypothetical protein
MKSTADMIVNVLYTAKMKNLKNNGNDASIRMLIGKNKKFITTIIIKAGTKKLAENPLR